MKNHRECAKSSAKEGMKHILVTFYHVGGGHPEWHIQADALEIVKMEWDMVLAFPPCTHLASSGASWFKEKQRDGRQQMGIGFFLAFTALDHVPMVAIENPVGIMSSIYQKPTQIIQPWEYGDPYEKTTCLWLKALPLLKPTVTEKPECERFEWIESATGRTRSQPKWCADAFLLPPNERAIIRSKTFPGIAKAMAEQWGCLDVPAAEKETAEEKQTQGTQIRMEL